MDSRPVASGVSCVPEAWRLNIKTTKSLPRDTQRKNGDMRPRAAHFHVVYTFGRGAGHTRTQLFSSTSNLWNPDTRSETGVLTYLRGRHPGYEITILDLEFQNNAGDPI